MIEEFKQKVDKRRIRIGIIGLGYVGLPLVMVFAKKGFPTTGFDIDTSKVEMLKSGKTYLKHIPETSVTSLNETGNFIPTSDFTKLGEVDVIAICVPTPLKKTPSPAAVTI